MLEIRYVRSAFAMTETFTVLGAEGLVGSYLVDHLQSKGYNVVAPCRLTEKKDMLKAIKGHVIYCIGITSDFMSRPGDCVEAHTILLNEVLERSNYTSLTYLSSTRLYLNAKSGSEDAELTVSPHTLSDIYNITKINGEALCHVANSSGRRVRVARLSNVIAPNSLAPDFFRDLLEQVKQGRVIFRSAPDSKKDYIFIDDVVLLLEKITLLGEKLVYNVASGHDVSNAMLAAFLRARFLVQVNYEENAPLVLFPKINIEKIKKEFSYYPLNPKDKLEVFIQNMWQILAARIQ
jgi:nucleoside-diphosphate-sugar epimerase